MRTDLQPELTKGQGLCKALASCEGHLQNGLMLFVAKRGILGHVDGDFTNSDEPVFIVTMLGGSLDLENILLQVKDMSVLYFCTEHVDCGSYAGLQRQQVHRDAPFPQHQRHAWRQCRWLRSVTETPSSVLHLHVWNIFEAAGLHQTVYISTYH